eukprot:6471911-Prymnesium_polylepis.2
MVPARAARGSRMDIPVVLVHMANGGFSIAEARHYTDAIEDVMARINPDGLQLITQRLGADLSELKLALHRALDTGEGEALVFNSHAGDNGLMATMKDIVERMGQASGIPVVWPLLLESRQRVGLCKPASRKPASIRAKEAVFATSSHMGLKLADAKAECPGSSAREPRIEDVANRQCAVFIVCAREDALSHARVLRSALAVRLDRDCTICSAAVVGDPHSIAQLKKSELCLVMLTKQLLSDPVALYEIWLALHLEIPLATVAIAGCGYDFAASSAVFSDLPTALRGHPQHLYHLQARLPKDTTVLAVGQKLHESITAIIALVWSPVGSNNHLAGVIEDITSRIPKGKRVAQTIFEERLTNTEFKK